MRLRIPLDTAPGEHTIILDGSPAAGHTQPLSESFSLTVAPTVAAAQPTRPQGNGTTLATTGENIPGLIGIALVLLLTGAVVSSLRRKPRQTTGRTRPTT